jgi:hypothetical protein
MVMSGAELVTKSDCEGEDQQQFTRLTELSYNGASDVAPTLTDCSPHRRGQGTTKTLVVHLYAI